MAVIGIPTAMVSPDFLHSNSTSHTWTFSAVAELIDNAYDPDVNATELWIDKRDINGETCLTFTDNGNGLMPENLHKMLSFGFCQKVAVDYRQPIGQYGNGFKSGSMRLGKDAIVFSRARDVMSVGLLSQTYLKSIEAETVLVPIVSWDLLNKTGQKTMEDQNNLSEICNNSIFKNEKELLSELESLEKFITGTRIIIYNLKKNNDSGYLELDFLSDPLDIRNPESQFIDRSTINRTVQGKSPEYKVSLREYCSILYLKPRMKIYVCGKKVNTKIISKSLSETRKDVYRPAGHDKQVRICFGFTCSKNPEDYGLVIYHNNRLIRAYDKVGYQRQPKELGVGVVGVVEAAFLTPTHNKQDFIEGKKYTNFISSAGLKLNAYWDEKREGPTITGAGTSKHKVSTPDWLWSQCEICLKWRKLPGGSKKEDLPENWFCRLNRDAAFNRCEVPEEPESEDEAVKKTTNKKKKQRCEQKRKKLQEEIPDKVAQVASTSSPERNNGQKRKQSSDSINLNEEQESEEPISSKKLKENNSKSNSKLDPGSNNSIDASESKTEDKNPDLDKLKKQNNKIRTKEQGVQTEGHSENQEEKRFKERLESFQRNVLEVLQKSEPDKDFGGPENVESIIADILRKESTEAGKESDSRVLYSGSELSSNRGKNIQRAVAAKKILTAEEEKIMDEAQDITLSRPSTAHLFSKGAHNQKEVLPSIVRAEVSKSVGLIYIDGNKMGTGFRVGEKYIVTCEHVIKNATVGEHIICYGRVSIEFGRISSSTNTDFSRIFGIISMAYVDKEHDFVVLELGSHDSGFPFPPALTCFGQVCWPDVYLVGHPDCKQMMEDSVIPFWLPEHNDTVIPYIDKLSKWSKMFFPGDKDHYKELRDLEPRKIMFHTTFNHGSSGSPGVMISEEKPCVVLMVRGGVPLCVYDNTYPSHTPLVRDNQKVEYGYAMWDIYEKMKNSAQQRVQNLANEIFKKWM